MLIQISKNRTEKKHKGAKKPNNRAAPYKAPAPKGPSLASAADKLVVSNLAQSVTQNDVKELFARIGIYFDNNRTCKICSTKLQRRW